MHKNRLYYYLPNVLVSVVLTFLAAGLTIMCLVSFMIMNPQTYTDSMYENNVDETAYEEICAYFDRQYAYTGVEADVFKSVVTKKDISSAMFAYVDSTFDYMSGKTNKLPAFEYDFTALEQSVDNDYHRWAKENETEFDEQLAKNEKQTIDSAEKVILTKLDIMMLSTINKENGYSTKIHNNYGLINKLIFGLSGAIILIIALLWLINRNHARNVFYWVSTALYSSSAILIVPAAILKFTHYYDRLAIKNEVIYSALTQSLYSITNKTLVCGIILLVCATIVMFIYVAVSKGMFKFRHMK